MPALRGSHKASVDVQQELRALWEQVDKLTKRESRLRRAVAGVAGGPADGGAAGAGTGYASIETPVGGPLVPAVGESLTLANGELIEISGDAVTDTVTIASTAASKALAVAMAVAL
jgi:hypothetical protein